MSEEKNSKYVSKAEELEKKQLFVKAAEYYLKAGFKEKAAKAYESGFSFKEAEALYTELGKIDDAKRCREKQKPGSAPVTWGDEQASFQKDWGNPY